MDSRLLPDRDVARVDLDGFTTPARYLLKSIEDESLMKNRIRRQKHSSAEINGIITMSLFLYAARNDYEWMTRFSFFSFFGRSRFSAAILK